MEARVDVRARFGHREAAPSGEADGRSVRAAQLGVRSMNFGQHWRTPDTRTVPYDVTLPLTFVISVLGRELPEYTRDSLTHPGTDPFEDALRNRQWPGAEAVLDDAELCSLALGWFGHDCLREWLGDGEPYEQPGYVINTIESAERLEGLVRFAGSARPTRLSVQYQDI